MADVVTDEGAPLEGLEATEAFKSGQSEVVPDADGRVRVMRGGTFGSVPAAELESFLAQNPGARLATATDQQERHLQREYGEGIANELKATGAAALRTATLGLSDLAAGAVGGDDTRTALRELSARNRLSDLAGTGLGIAATTLATGGGSGLAKALSATPAGLAMRAGQAVSELGVAGSTAARVGAQVAGGALEGAIFGGGQGVTDWALNPDAQQRTAERLMASMASRAGEGAILGGLATAGLTGAGRLVGAGATKAGKTLKSLFSKADDATRGLGKEAAESSLEQGLSQNLTLDQALSQDLRSSGNAGASVGDDITIELESGRALGTGKNPLKELAEGATARQRFAVRQQEATERVSKAFTDMAQAADDIASEANIALKPQQMRKLMRELPPESLDASTGVVVDALSQVDDAITNALGRGREGFEVRGIQALKAAKEDLDLITGKLTAPRNTDELADVMIGLDRIKRRLGSTSKRAASGANADQGASQILRDSYGTLRNVLEDESIFGSGAANMQRSVNKAWTDYLDYATAYESNLALPRGQSVTRSARDGFEKVPAADPSKIGAALNRTGTAENAHFDDVLLNGAKRHADLLETLAAHYEVTPALKTAAANARKQAQVIEREAASLKSIRTTGDRFDETIQALKDLPFGGEQLAKAKVSLGRTLNLAMEHSATARAVAGASTTAEATAAAKAALNVDASAAANRLGSLQRVYMASQDIGRKISDSTAKYVKSFGGAATRATAAALPAATGSNSRAERQRKFDDAYARVAEFERDPRSAIRRALNVQYGLGTNAPVLASAYAAQTVRAAEFLSTKMPTRDPSSTMFGADEEGKPPKVSDNESREFLEYVHAIENPLVVFDQLQSGRVSPRTVEAVKSVYPRMYEDIQHEIMARVEDAGTRPPYKARLQLGILFNVPTDPALAPDFLQMLQSSATATSSLAQPNQPILSPSQRSAPDTAGLIESKSAALQQPI